MIVMYVDDVANDVVPCIYECDVLTDSNVLMMLRRRRQSPAEVTRDAVGLPLQLAVQLLTGLQTPLLFR
jgi:hypothetical protein